METLRSILVGTLGLDVVAGIAVWLTALRYRLPSDLLERGRLLLPAGSMIALQAAHFAEELDAGFHVRFPELFGLVAWPPLPASPTDWSILSLPQPQAGTSLVCGPRRWSVLAASFSPAACGRGRGESKLRFSGS